MYVRMYLYFTMIVEKFSLLAIFLFGCLVVFFVLFCFLLKLFLWMIQDKMPWIFDFG